MKYDSTCKGSEQTWKHFLHVYDGAVTVEQHVAVWVSDTRPVAVMRRARDSWRSKQLALVSREIIG